MALSDFQQANRCLVSKDYQQAIALYVRHAAAHPAEAAKCFTKAGEAAKRAGGSVSATDVAPGVERMLVCRGNLQGAEALFRRALSLDPDHVPALRELALILPEDRPERCQLLERAAAVRDDLMVLNALGDAYLRLRQPERAYESYRRAQRYSPNDRTAYDGLTKACQAMGRDAEADAWAVKWQETDGSRPRVDRPRDRP